jgi:hypothetical protein
VIAAGSDRDLVVTIPRGPCIGGTFVEQSFQAEGECRKCGQSRSWQSKAVEDLSVQDWAVQDWAVQDGAVKDWAGKDVAVEDMAVKDVAVEDLAVEDLGGNWRAACQLRQAHAKSRGGRPFAGANAFGE